MNEEEGQGLQAKSRSEPPSLDALSTIFQAPALTPSPGEIWRSAWGSCVQLVMVANVGDDEVDAVPVSPDVELADDETVRVEPRAPLAHSLGAWCGLRRRLPLRVLDVRVSAVGAEDLRAVLDGGGQGSPITSVLDERDQVRTVMAGRMAELAEATWLPSTSNIVDLAERVRERKLKPSQLAKKLGVTPGDVTDLIRGDRVASPEQAEILAPLLDGKAEQLLSVQLDPDLIWALDQPKFRRRLAERGLAEHEPDEGAWRLQVATSKLPIAARTTGVTDGRTRWMGLIEAYLDER